MTKIAKNGKLTTPVKFSNFSASKNLCACHHINLDIKKTQNIRNGENQLLFASVSPRKAVCTQTISRWFIHVLTWHLTRAALASKAKSLDAVTKEILKRGHWFLHFKSTISKK